MFSAFLCAHVSLEETVKGDASRNRNTFKGRRISPGEKLVLRLRRLEICNTGLEGENLLNRELS